jgi:MFS family permease
MALNLLNGAFGMGAFLSPLLVLVMERSYASAWQGLQMSFWSVAVCGVCIGIATFTGAKKKLSPHPNAPSHAHHLRLPLPSRIDCMSTSVPAGRGHHGSDVCVLSSCV